MAQKTYHKRLRQSGKHRSTGSGGFYTSFEYRPTFFKNLLGTNSAGSILLKKNGLDGLDVMNSKKLKKFSMNVNSKFLYGLTRHLNQNLVSVIYSSPTRNFTKKTYKN